MKKGFSLNNTPSYFLFIRSYAKVAYLLVIGLALLFLDFVTKAYVFNVLSFNENCFNGRGCLDIQFFQFGGITCSLGLALNKGAAWGLFSNYQVLLLCTRFAVIVGMLFYLFFLNRNIWAQMPLMLIIAGAIGNVIDFFLYGFVVDFIHFNLWGYEFPLFNVADSAITIGVIWLLLLGLTKKKKTIPSSSN